MIEPLPSGYDERARALVEQITPIAERLMDIGEEFAADQVNCWGNGIRVRITRAEPPECVGKVPGIMEEGGSPE